MRTNGQSTRSTNLTDSTASGPLVAAYGTDQNFDCTSVAICIRRLRAFAVDGSYASSEVQNALRNVSGDYGSIMRHSF
jgi:hypothetical protein